MISNVFFLFRHRTFAEQQNTEYIFVVDADAHVDNTSTLIELIKQNRCEMMNFSSFVFQ